MTFAATARRATTAGLRSAQTVARALPDGVRAPLARMFKPAFERAMAFVGRPELEARVRELRRELVAQPQRAELWHELGLCLAGRMRSRAAVDALVRAAELDHELQVVTQALHTRPRLRRVAGSDRHVERMQRIADEDPTSASKHLLVGAFLLDHARLDLGRERVRRGYEMLVDHARPADDRPGPDFLIVGPPKTGTTSLYDLLAQHPQIVPTPRKELQFWSHRHGRSVDHYSAYFPALPAGFVTGEASTNYLTSREAAEGTAAEFPRTKVIVMHRDPVARAYSEYQMRRRDHRIESRSFDQAIAFERRRIGPDAPISMRDVPDLPRSYHLGSCILPYLEMWVDALGVGQVMVVETAELSAHRQRTVDAVHAFLGLPPASAVGRENRNVHDYAPIANDVDERLRTWFAPHEAALADFRVRHRLVVEISS